MHRCVRLGCLAVLAVAGCGGATTSTSSPAGTRSPSSVAVTPTPHPSRGLVAAFDSSQNVVVVDLSGRTIATIPGSTSGAPAPTSVTAAGPLGIAYVDVAGTLQLIKQDGSTATLQAFGAAPDFLLFSADGMQWVYAYLTINGDNFETKLYRSGSATGSQPVLVTDHTEKGTSLQPLFWPTGNRIVVEHLPQGIGGVSPFPEGFVFDTSYLDLGSGALTDLHARSECVLSDVSASGGQICVTGYGTTSTKPTAKISTPGQAPITLTFAADVRAIGSCLLRPDGGALVATTGSETPPFSYALVASDSHGVTKAWGPKDVLPEALLPDGRVIVIGSDSQTGPVLVLNPDGTATGAPLTQANTVAAVSAL